MDEDPLITGYLKGLLEIRKHAKDLELSDNEVDDIFKKSFEVFQKPKQLKQTKAFFKVIVFISSVLLVCYVLLYVHQPTSSIVLRNVQGLIYPGLKFVRFLAIPIIKYFPRLTELYDETCLIENPFFYVNNMECWPCETVHAVINLTGYTNHTLYDSGIPFISKVHQNLVHYEDIRQLYTTNSEVFNKDATYLKANSNLTYSRDLLSFNPKRASSLHISWRLNRMLPVRLLRKLFPKPHIIPERAGQSIERYLMIDGPSAEGYSLPGFECSNVFVVQGSGERSIILKPSKECGLTCRTVSVVLKPLHVLWYNWWYWRPISLPVENSTNISINYINSYC